MRALRAHRAAVAGGRAACCSACCRCRCCGSSATSRRCCSDSRSRAAAAACGCSRRSRRSARATCRRCSCSESSSSSRSPRSRCACFYHARVRRAPPWDCGFPALTPRMQDTAEGFGQPIRHIFLPFFRMHRELPTPFDSAPRYRVRVEDRIWHGLYLQHRRGRALDGRSHRRAAAGPHRDLSALQLRDPAAAAGGRAVTTRRRCWNSSSRCCIAVAVAPLYLGWINQWRACLQNRRPPPLLQPYRTHRQAVPQGSGDRRAGDGDLPRHALRDLRHDGRSPPRSFRR